MHGFNNEAQPALQELTPATAEKSPPKPRAKDKFNRFKWRDDVRADTTVTANIKVLVCGIAKFVNGGSGEAVVSTITLAKACGFSDAWVRKVIPKAINTGWLDVQFGSKGRGVKHCNRYNINPEKRARGAVLADASVTNSPPENRTIKPHFSPLKPHPVFEEPLNLRKKGGGGGFAPPDSWIEENLTTNKTTDEARLSPVLSAPDGAKTSDVDKNLKLNASKESLGTPPNVPNAMTRDNDAARRGCDAPSSAPVAPPSDYFRPGIPTQRPDAKTLHQPPACAAIETPPYDEGDLEFLLEIFPNQRDLVAAREAFEAALRDGAEVGALLDRAVEIGFDPERSNISVAEFCRSGYRALVSETHR